MNTALQAYRSPLMGELLCIADSYWVLGHWFIKTMMNGRCISDFNAMAGFSQDTLGNTRALFRFMEEAFALPAHQLEFGRTGGEIHSMELLDGPPENWSDFAITAYLADEALWQLLKSLDSQRVPELATLAASFGESLYFRRLYVEGWIEAFTDAEKEQARTALAGRLNLAGEWFGTQSGSDNDELVKAAVRTTSLMSARTSFLERVDAFLAKEVSLLDQISTPSEPSGNWDPIRRRARRALPAALWNFMVPTSEEAVLARRPLAISVTDNLDLFAAPV